VLPSRIGADDRGGSEPAKAVGFQPLLAERVLKILALRLIEDRFHAAFAYRSRVRTTAV
jgi:hypothetical protein